MEGNLHWRNRKITQGMFLVEHRRPEAPPPQKCLNTSTKTNQNRMDKAWILDWFTRGVQEAIYIRAHQPTLRRGEIQPSSDLDKCKAGQVTCHMT